MSSSGPQNVDAVFDALDANSLVRQAPSLEVVGTMVHAPAEATLINRTEASRRIKEARDLGPRHGLTGEPVAPVLAATSAAQRQGKLGAGQVASATPPTSTTSPSLAAHITACCDQAAG